MKTIIFTLSLLTALAPAISGTSQSGYALDFDGNDYVTVSDFSLSGFNALSIEAWIYLDRYSTNQYSGSVIFTKEWVSCSAPWHVIYFSVTSANFASGTTRKLSIGVNTGGGTYASAVGTTDVTLNTWHHVAAVWDGANVYLYLDGVLDGVGTGSGTVSDISTLVHIGERLTCGSADEAVDGRMDEVRFWSTGRTQAEIMANMYTQLNGTEPGLYAYWKFDEGSGQVAHDSGPNNFHGMLGSTTGPDTNDPSWVGDTPPLGLQNALSFDGSNDYVNCGNDPALNNADFSIEAWIWLAADVGNTQARIVSKQQTNLLAYSMGIFGNGYGAATGNQVFMNIQTGSGGINALSSAHLQANRWYHIAGTHQGNVTRIFINGYLDHEAITGVQTTNINNDLTIGCLFMGGNDLFHFNGKIDEVRVWKKALGQEEVICAMNRELFLPASLGDLVAYYRFNQNSGTTAIDLSQQENHGTLVNMNPLTAWVESGAMIQNVLEFNGTVKTVQCGNSSSLDITGDITIEAWVYPKSIDPVTYGNRIFCRTGWPLQYRGYELSHYGSPGNYKIVFGSGNGAAWDQLLFDAPVALNAWNHIAVSINSNVATAFLNGIPLGTAVRSACQGGAFTAYIGSLQNSIFFYDGYIDELRIWNSARTTEQIRNNMYKKTEQPESMPNLAAYYRFDQPSGTLLPDLSQYGNHGTLVNMDPASDWVASTAPVPYRTAQNGNWNSGSTWLAGQHAPVNAWARVQNDHSLNVNVNAETSYTCNCGQMTVQPGSDFTVTEDLFNNSGTGGLVFQSDISATASLLHNTDGVEGTFERYNTGNVWHFVSPPVADGIAQIFHGKYLQAFDEPSNSYSDIIPDLTPLNVMEGYALFTFTDWKSQSAGKLNNGAIGTVNNLNRSGSGFSYGWNLVGNPYPSAIDWNAASGWVKTNINAAIYIENNGNWATWNGSVGTNGGSRYIAAGQGFFAEVSEGFSEGTLMMDNPVRLHNPVQYFKSSPGNTIRLTASGNRKSDETVIIFNEDATDGFDNHHDAHKLFATDPDYPQIYSAVSDEMAVNVMPFKPSIPLGFSSGTGGAFGIRLTEKNADDHLHIWLEDKKMNILYPIEAHGEYLFEYQLGDDANRFILHLLPDENRVSIWSYHTTVYVNHSENASGEAKIFNMMGQELKNSRLTPGLNAIHMPVAGYYVVAVSSTDGRSVSKVMIR